MAAVEPIAYTPTQELIEAFHTTHSAVSLAKKELPFRKHLGLSGVGNECSRAVWLGFRWAVQKQFPSNVIRLFNRGHNEEDVFIEYLQAVGVTVQSHHPETGKQFKAEYAGTHVGGSTDGFAYGFTEKPDAWHLLELKTHSLKSFESLVKSGVKRSKPVHWVQVQTYMKSFNLKWCYYMAVCKNDDRLYTEWIELDEEAGEKYINLAIDLVYAEEPPERIALSSTDHRCRSYCDFRDVCWHRNDAEPARNCRTCMHSYPNETGTWGCRYNGVTEDLDAYNPCSAYDKHSAFVKPEPINMSLMLGK